MKRLLFTILAFLLLVGVAWGATFEGVTLEGCGSLTAYPDYFWELSRNLEPSSGSSTYDGVFTHAGTNRTRVNPDTGLIEAVGANVARFEEVGGHRALLIEPAGTNLVTYSEQFDDASWTKTRSSITANATTAPDGTLTADKLVEDGTASNSHFLNGPEITAATFTDNARVTISAYIKQAELTWVRLTMLTKAGVYPGWYFNVGTGVVGSVSSGALSSGITPAANGFYRCWVTVDIDSGATNPRFQVVLAEGDGDATINGDSASGIYVWGAQVEESPVPSSYIKSEGATSIINDDAADDDTGDWNAVDCTLTFDTDHYVATMTNTITDYFRQSNVLTAGDYYQFTAKVYIPSSNTTLDSVRVTSNGADYFNASLLQIVTTTDSWVDVDITGAISSDASDDDVFFYATTNGGLEATGLTVGDEFWVKDIVVTRIGTTRQSESGEPHFTLPLGLFDAQGTAIVWWRPGYGYGDVINNTNYGILSLSDLPYSGIYSRKDAGTSQIRSYDGATALSYDLNFTSNTWYKLAVKWGYLVGGVKKFRVGVDSGSGIVWGTEETFDGSYTLGTYLRLGYGLFGPMHLRNLMLFRSVLTDAQINMRGGTP